MRGAYPDIDVVIDGDLDRLSPAVSLACYRIIQESLTNARRHAPGAAVRVQVRRDPTCLVAEVVNAPAAARAGETWGASDVDGGGSADGGTDDGATDTDPRQEGYGLVGMRERADMLGGTLESGPTPAGGWRTRVTIPTPEGPWS